MCEYQSYILFLIVCYFCCALGFWKGVAKDRDNTTEQGQLSTIMVCLVQSIISEGNRSLQKVPPKNIFRATVIRKDPLITFVTVYKCVPWAVI